MSPMGRCAVSAVAAVGAVAALNAVGESSERVRDLLVPVYLFAARFGTIHSPSTFVYYGSQWLLASLVIWVGVSAWDATRRRVAR